MCVNSVKIIFACLLLVLCACSSDGSGSFFEDPPDCFYDNLFGCETFDIPWDSSYYGLSTARTFSITSGRNRSTKNTNFSGNWKGLLSRKSSSCDYATPLKLNGTLQVSQKNDRISMKIPLSSTRSVGLRGKTISKGLQATGSGFLSLCSYSANSKLSSANFRNGRFDLQVTLKCILQDACEIRYSGNVAR